MNNDNVKKTILDKGIGSVSREDLEHTLLQYLNNENKKKDEENKIIVKKDTPVAPHIAKLLKTDKPSEFHIAAASQILQGVDIYSNEIPDTKFFQDITKAEEKKKEESNTNCTICRDTIENKDLSITNCMHFFHAECLKNWIKEFDAKTKDPICPNCREKLILLPSEKKEKKFMTHRCVNSRFSRFLSLNGRYNFNTSFERKERPTWFSDYYSKYKTWYDQVRSVENIEFKNWNRRGGISNDFSNDYKIQKQIYKSDNNLGILSFPGRLIRLAADRKFHTRPSAVELTRTISHIHRIAFQWSVKDKQIIERAHIETKSNSLLFIKYCKKCGHEFASKQKVIMHVDVRTNTIYIFHNECSVSIKRLPYKIQLREHAFLYRLLRNSLLDWHLFITKITKNTRIRGRSGCFSFICNQQIKVPNNIFNTKLSTKMKRILRRGN